jgi:nicotinamidase/pyrazinamidase
VTDAERERLLEILLAGTPDRVLDVVLATDPAARAELESMRATLARMPEALDPVAPPASLRARVLASATSRQAALEPRRALLVIDMIEDHLTPGRPLEVPRARAIVPALQQRLVAARAAGIPVVYVVDSHAPDDPDYDVWPTHALEGSDGARVWPEIAPLAGEPVIPKRTYSAFHRSELESVLDRLGIDTLVLTGCATELGLLATATDALMRGFHVEVPPDSQAGASEIGEQVALGVLHVMPPYDPARRRAIRERAG